MGAAIALLASACAVARLPSGAAVRSDGTRGIVAVRRHLPSVRHALAFSLPPDLMGSGPLWPATTEDGANYLYTGGVHMGSLFPIPGWVDVNALDLTPQGFMIAHTLQDYGAYLVDAGGNFALFAETAAENMLSGVRNDISTLQNQLQIVTNNSPNAVGGGGTPRVPLAPALR